MLRGWLSIQPFYSPDDGSSSGGGEGSGGSNKETGFQRLLDKYERDAVRVAEKLYDENFGLREDKRQLKSENEELKKKVPAESDVVLKGDEAKAFQELKAIGELSEIKKNLTKFAELEKELTSLKKKETIETIAAAANMKPAVLMKLGGDLEYEVEEKDVEGVKKKVVTVKQGDKKVPLEDYAKQEWADFIPALTTTPETITPSTIPQNNGTFFPRQVANGNGSGRTSNPVDEYFTKTYLKKKDERKA